MSSVSLRLEPGERIGIIGPNGAGKSTLLLALCGFLPVAQGTCRLDGVSIENSSEHFRASRGLLLAHASLSVFPHLTCAEHLALARSLAVRAKPRDIWGLHGGAFDFIRQRNGVQGRFLSGGERQLLSLAMALIRSPKLLLLDEPTRGLAVELQLVIAELLTSCDFTLMIVEHNHDWLRRVCTRTLLVKSQGIMLANDTGCPAQGGA